MILEIDTQAKTIKVKGQCNMNELITWLMKQYEFEWMSWTFVQNYEDRQWYPSPKPYQPTYPGQGIFPLINPQPTIIPPYQGPWVGDDPNHWKITTGSTSSLVDSGTTFNHNNGNGSNIVDDLLKKS